MRNALNSELLENIISGCQFLQSQHHLTTVVIGGRGPSFCAGADIHAEPGAGLLPSGASARARRNHIQLGRRAVRAIEGLDAITIAAVQGHAAGGGFGLMAACDLKVVCIDARLWLPEVGLVLPCAFALPSESNCRIWLLHC